MARSRKATSVASALLAACVAPPVVIRAFFAPVKKLSSVGPVPLIGVAPTVTAFGLILPTGVTPAAPVTVAPVTVAPVTVAPVTVAPVSVATKNVAYVTAALANGPLTVNALASGAGVTPGAIRNAIDNIRRARGKAAVLSLGGSVFSLG